MGTRSTIKFLTGKDNDFIGGIYQQYDGYPSGKGLELAEFLNEVELINGIQNNTLDSNQANGFDCLIAQFIARNKTVVGGLYMTTEYDEQEWNYIVKHDFGNDDYEIQVNAYGEVEFIGNKAEFLEYCKNN